MRDATCKSEHARQLDHVITGSLTSRRYKLELLKRKVHLSGGIIITYRLLNYEERNYTSV